MQIPALFVYEKEIHFFYSMYLFMYRNSFLGN